LFYEKWGICKESDVIITEDDLEILTPAPERYGE
jgi:Xaa-Pro aminopeptidase